ncbi:MAG: translation initiation factor IF-2, partial [Bdellovibrionales bacterium]
LNVILKVDVRGSLEALKVGLGKLKSENVSLKIVHSAVGAVTESDVLLASTVQGIILGFNVRPDGKASKLARDKAVEVHTYSIIYELLDYVKKMMLGLLEPEYLEENLGKAEVRNIFHISKLGTVAGSYVTEGKFTRSSFIRLVRDGRIVHDGNISSLKRFKDDAKEVGSGLECGIVIENFNDIKPNDILESYIKKEISRTEL